MRSVVRALQLQPVFFEAAFNLAALLQEIGQEDEAIDLFEQAAKVAEKQGDVRATQMIRRQAGGLKKS